MPISNRKDSDLIEVAAALPVHSVYTYSVPERLNALATLGKRVLAPFGHRKITGYIIGFPDKAPEQRIKSILEIPDEAPLFPENMIPFFKWMALYYKHPVGEVIKTAIPGDLNLYEYKTVHITEEGRRALNREPMSEKDAQILGALDRQDGATQKKLEEYTGGQSASASLRKMENLGWVAFGKKMKGGKTKSLMVKYVSLASPETSENDIPVGPAKEKLLAAIRDAGEISVSELKKLSDYAARHVKELEEGGIVAGSWKREYRDPLGSPIPKDRPLDLNKEQRIVVASVLEKIDDGFHAFLLTGVTGSGKTEVYLHLAAQTLERGKSVLILAPEIALISQMVRRFRARFGDSLAVLHSGLSDGERLDQWARINAGEVQIAIGARSAIFAPFENPGLIIVDEEHDTSYKQESRFRYNARDLAVVRAKQCGCVVLLGSATPSIQSYYNVKVGKFEELTLKNRIENRPLAEISVVDLRTRRSAKGYKRFITPELSAAMEEALAKKEQVLLFLNRRGFASYPVCSTCGEALRCKNCEITLTLHKSVHAFQCHFCGYSMASASPCPSCGSTNIMLLGLGSEKIEETVKTMFPKARTARMDRDSTRRKGSLAKMLRELRNGEIDILVGTQMVAKGHDFPNITLVGIICADLSLSFPDFRAGERTFQLLAQVAGRAGRGEMPGQVILQTYNPNHFSILAAKEQDFVKFYNQEIMFRKALSYPPYSRLAQLAISSRDLKKAERFSKDLGDFLQELRGSDPVFDRSLDILGPIEAPLPKIDGNYRWQILIKGANPTVLHNFVNRLVYQNSARLNHRDARVAVDMDPCSML